MLTALAVVAVLGVLFVAAVVATREGAVLVDAPPDAADVTLPAGMLVSSDLAAVRFGLALRGYRMTEVDAVLDRVQVELAERDARILQLEGGAAAGAGPDAVTHGVTDADAGAEDPADSEDRADSEDPAAQPAATAGSAGPVGVAARAGVTGLVVGTPAADDLPSGPARESDARPSSGQGEGTALTPAVATDDSAFGGLTGQDDETGATAVTEEARETAPAIESGEGDPTGEGDRTNQTGGAGRADESSDARRAEGSGTGTGGADDDATGWAFDEGGAAAAAAHPGLDDDWGMPQVGDLEPAAADLPDAHEPDETTDVPAHTGATDETYVPGATDGTAGTGGTGGTGGTAGTSGASGAGGSGSHDGAGVDEAPAVVTSRPSAVGAAGEPLSSAPVVAPPVADPSDPGPVEGGAPGATGADAPRDAEPVPPAPSPPPAPPVFGGSGDAADGPGPDDAGERPAT